MKENISSKKSKNRAKMHFVVITKKQLLISFFCIILIGAAVFGGMSIASAVTAPSYKHTVVIDAGHGGMDSGVTGKNGYKESDFNLTMAKDLGDYLSKAGFKVIYTRSDEGGLYKADDKNKKLADMAARKKIIVDADPDLVISIHANKFPGDGRRGAQVFFDPLSSQGKRLADSVQAGLNGLNRTYVGREFSALSGDYFMLKCTTRPSVIVECGFLSNPEDEKLLSDEEYRKKLAFALYSGIVGYFEV